MPGALLGGGVIDVDAEVLVQVWRYCVVPVNECLPFNFGDAQLCALLGCFGICCGLFAGALLGCQLVFDPLGDSVPDGAVGSFDSVLFSIEALKVASFSGVRPTFIK